MINYVLNNTPDIWAILGWTTSIGCLIGATIYDGNLKLVQKGIITIITYAFFISLMNFNRYSFIFESNPSIATPARIAQAYSNNVVIIMVTAFYLFGMFLGVLTSYLVRKKNKRKV